MKPRLPQAAVLSREHFVPTAPEPHVSGYDSTMAAFYTAQGLPVNAWSTHSLARLHGPGALKGQHLLTDALGAHGIGLR